MVNNSNDGVDFIGVMLLVVYILRVFKIMLKHQDW